MATRPTVVPEWATAVTPPAPSAGAVQTGHVSGAAANPDDVNYVEKYNAQWATYLSELSPSSNVISGDSTLVLVGGSADATRVRFGLLDNNYQWTYSTGPTVVLGGWKTTSGNYWLGYGHVVAAGTIDDGYRYGYSSTQLVTDTIMGSATPLILDFYLTDSHSGWQVSGDVETAAIGFTVGTGYVTFGHGAGAAVSWYRDLIGVLTGHNAVAKTAGGTVLRLNGISCRIDTGTSDAVDLEFVAQDRSTHAETLVYSIAVPATTAAANYTDTGAHTVDLAANRYYARLTMATGGGTAFIRDLKLTVDKYAVE